MWDVEGNPWMIPDTRPGAPKYHGWWKGDQGEVGVFLHGYESLWLPAALLRENRQAQLTSALFAASRYKTAHLHINKGLAGAPDEARARAKDTATIRVVTEAFALVIIADSEAPAYPGMPGAKIDQDASRKDARLIDLAAAELFKIVPNAGSYVSESNYFNPRWQNAYYASDGAPYILVVLLGVDSNVLVAVLRVVPVRATVFWAAMAKVDQVERSDRRQFPGGDPVSL
jgi:hypothetical protein